MTNKYINWNGEEKHQVITYLTPDNLNKMESVPKGNPSSLSDKTVNHTGFSKSRVINDNKKSERSEGTLARGKREQQLDRLAILQSTQGRLIKDLERTKSFIKSIKSDLSI